MVEGGLIDQAHHGGQALRALRETVSFDQSIEAALEMVDTLNTLIIVTADHGHGLTFSGYADRGAKVTGNN